ncbi:MAG TPA: hypothetical protein VKD70_07585 [Candidatus Acidoferrum sp.]|nr:hypothetical protein [Candidatus Acidoferrum sp.]
MKDKHKFRIGDWVEVRCKEEILQTLDADGLLEGMPFMPEMLAFCGKKFQVYRIAHKTCDYSSFPYKVRRLARTVHLQTRCDGHAHGGCQAGCLLYWKEDWLRSVEEHTFAGRSSKTGDQAEISVQNLLPGKHKESLLFACVAKQHAIDESPTYICQMTQIPTATTPLAWWDPRQYLQDYFSGNVNLKRVFTGFIYWIYYGLSQAGIGLGPAMRWFYNKICILWGQSLFPRTPGCIPDGQSTPLVELNLQPGELVRVKSHEEILKTVDNSNRNRGMYWDAELVPYCGGTYKVTKRVSRLISERTGKMLEMKNPCIVLDSVVCQARYSPCRMFCPKSMYPYWREAWLERVGPQEDSPRSDAKTQ